LNDHDDEVDDCDDEEDIRGLESISIVDGQGDPENWQFNCNSSVGDRIVSANKLTPATAFFNPRNNLKAIQVQILNPSYTNRQIEQVATLSKRNLNAFLMKGVSPIV